MTSTNLDNKINVFDELDENKNILCLDYGTYSSSVSYVNSEGKAVILDYSSITIDGASVLPSRFAYIDGNSYCCEEITEKMLFEHPDCIIEGTKMMPSTQAIKLGGKEFTAEEINKTLKKHILDTSLELLFVNELIDIDPSKAVIVQCVPDKFSSTERLAAKKETEEASNSGSVTVWPEAECASTYAAMKLEASKIKLIDRDLITLDIGGGTADYSYIQVDYNHANPFFGVISDGLVNKAGNLMRDKLYDLILSKLKETGKSNSAYNEAYNSLTAHPNGYDALQLLRATEKAKMKLSKESEVRILVSTNNFNEYVLINRSEFEKELSSLIDEYLAKMKEIVVSVQNPSDKLKGELKDKKRSIHKNFDILLVGGASQVPLVKTRIEKEYPNSKIYTLDPQKIVCLGGALVGKALANGEYDKETGTTTNTETRSTLIIPKTANALCVKCTNTKTNTEYLHCIIENGEVLGTINHRSFNYAPITEDQEVISFTFYEIPSGKMDSSYDLELGNKTEHTYTHRFVHPASLKNRVKLTVSLTGEGILQVSSIDDMDNIERNMEEYQI